jgi:hypothetical protein
MYDGVGIHWAPSIPAFISLLFLPFPFFFYKYGAAVREKCKYAAESDQYMKKLAENSIEEKKKMVSTAEPEASPSHEIPPMEMERVATVQSI